MSRTPNIYRAVCFMVLVIFNTQFALSCWSCAAFYLEGYRCTVRPIQVLETVLLCYSFSTMYRIWVG